MKQVALAVCLAALLATPAAAQRPYDWADDRDPYWASRAMTEGGARIRNSPRYHHYTDRYHRWRRHRARMRYVYRPRYHYEPRQPQVYGYIARLPAHAPRCAGEVSAVGTEHYSEDEAKKASIKSWMAEVRHRLGTEMMDIANARNVMFRCVTSTPGDRISDKIAQWTRGDLLKECRVVAIPCRPDVDDKLPRDVGR